MLKPLCAVLALAGWLILGGFALGQDHPSRIAAAPKTITQIRVKGQPIKVFDHTRNQQESDNYPDAGITAWKEVDGTVNLMIPHMEAYRMRGPDLEHLTVDPNKIYSSQKSGEQTPEHFYNYDNWLVGPYSLDGQHFYSLAHTEWYACLLNGDCSKTGANGQSAAVNSWSNTVNSFVSADGGASWQLNTVHGNHAVAKAGYYWTGSKALADKIYLQAMNHSGVFQPTRVIKEGHYYYAIGYYIHRDFTKINPAKGIYQAPVDKFGYVLIRTSDVTNPNGWQAWTTGSTFEPITRKNFGVFLPQRNRSTLYGATPPQIIFDTNAQRYILIHTIFGGHNPVYFMTTQSLAAPSWSDSKPILGTAKLITDPAGSVTGFNDTNYVSLLDDSSSGFNFEFTNGSPMLFFSTFPLQYGGDNTARDAYRLQLSIAYR